MARLIQFSEAASLALHGAAFMALSPEKAFSARRIAERAGVSENHLVKVLQRLVKAGLLASVRGPKGGYRFAVPPGDISLLEVYEAVEGRLETSFCPARRSSCVFRGCLFGGILDRLNGEIAEYFRNTRLVDFAAEEAARAG